MNTVEQGIHTMHMQDYLQYPAYSSSTAWTAYSRSAAHAVGVGDDHVANTAMDIGSAAHDYLLEGGTPRVVECAYDDWRTKAAREERDSLRAQGKVPVLSKHMGIIRDMKDAAIEYLESCEIGNFLTSGKPELTLIWDEGNIQCKARPDWLTADHNLLVHYKTTESANPVAFARSRMSAMGYDMAWAFYNRGMQRITGHIPQSVFLVQETSSPYACSLVGLDPVRADLAYRRTDAAIELWKACAKSGKYPAYPSRIHYAEARPWEIAEVESNEMLSKCELDGGIPL